MVASKEDKVEFLAKLEQKMKETIELNKIDELEDFDAGLYITNIFNKLYKDSFQDLDEESDKILRATLWKDAYSKDNLRKYEDFILKLSKK